MLGFVSKAREAALGLGVTKPDLLQRWIMVDALLAPAFYASPDVTGHFQMASGDPDTKAGDVFAALKLHMTRAGRASEVWW